MFSFFGLIFTRKLLRESTELLESCVEPVENEKMVKVSGFKSCSTYCKVSELFVSIISIGNSNGCTTRNQY